MSEVLNHRVRLNISKEYSLLFIFRCYLPEIRLQIAALLAKLNEMSIFHSLIAHIGNHHCDIIWYQNH